MSAEKRPWTEADEFDRPDLDYHRPSEEWIESIIDASIDASERGSTHQIITIPVEKLRLIIREAFAGLDLQCEHTALYEALAWALPLAMMSMETHRLSRLSSGHNDIGAGRERNKTEALIGLYDSEVENMDKARAALSAAMPQKEGETHG